MDSELLSSECNSFALHSKFLCYTTLGHTLRFVRLSEQFKGGKEDDVRTPQQYDDTVRDIERGSQIVCVTPNDIRVVLQVDHYLPVIKS